MHAIGSPRLARPGRAALVALALLLVPTQASSLGILVDVDPTASGIQSSYSVTAGASPFAVDVYVVGDGTTAFDTFAYAVEFNDGGMVLALSGSTVADPTGLGILAGALNPSDSLSGAGVGPGSVLATIPYQPSGTGTQGAFTGSAGGAGIFDLLGGPFYGGAIPAGQTHLLTRTMFSPLAAGVSDVSVVGAMPLSGTPFILPTMIPNGALPVPNVAEFYETATLGVGYQASITSGTVTVVPTPEPGTASLVAFGVLALGLECRRTRRQRGRGARAERA